MVEQTQCFRPGLRRCARGMGVVDAHKVVPPLSIPHGNDMRPKMTVMIAGSYFLDLLDNLALGKFHSIPVRNLCGIF